MSDKVIRLDRDWIVGSHLDGGGFAEVYRGSGEDGAEVAIKFIPNTPGALRELEFKELEGIPNVMPVLDSGSHDEFLVLVMPLAETNLRTYIEGEGALPENVALEISKDILRALQALEGKVVHRDLKPENILLWSGHWHVADFGIARLADALTSPNTRKRDKTWQYAAPEQWREQRATAATDVYAFGVMLYEMLAGFRPFAGPDFYTDHISKVPPPLTNVLPSVAALVADCLHKPQESRPTAASLLKRIELILNPPRLQSPALQKANLAVVQSGLGKSAVLSAQQEGLRKRAELVHASKLVFDGIVSRFCSQIAQDATAAQISRGARLEVHLGRAVLTIDQVMEEPIHALSQQGYHAAFDVIASSSIKVQMPQDKYGYQGGAHSLWYCDAEVAGLYRWYELAFTHSGFVAQSSATNPFNLRPISEQAVLAINPIQHTVDLFWTPSGIDQGEEDTFILRWIEWFASAADGNLQFWQHHRDRSHQPYRQGNHVELNPFRRH